MQNLFGFIGVIHWLIAVAGFVAAPTGIQQIGATGIAMIGTLFIVGALLYGPLDEIRNELVRKRREQSGE